MPEEMLNEQATLGAALHMSDARPAIRRLCGLGLRADHFFYSRHAEIFRAMVALTDSDQPVDVLTVAAELERRGKREAFATVGGPKTYVHSLPNLCPSIANARSYVQRVIEYSVLRRKQKAALEVAEACRQGDHAGVQEAEQKLTSIRLPNTQPVRPLRAIEGLA